MPELAEILEFEQGVVEAERPFNDKLKQDGVHYYDIEKLIASEQSMLLVAADENQLVGTGHISIKDSLDYLVHDQHGYLGLMFVAPGYRGLGIVRTIIEHLLTWARSKGIKDFYLDVYAENSPAVRAYEKFGFKPNMIEMTLHDQ